MSGLPGFGEAPSGVVQRAGWIVLAIPCGIDHVPHFRLAEGLGDQVKASEVQHLGPQAIVRQPGSHDQQRQMRRGGDAIKQVQPASVGQFGFAENYRHIAFLQDIQGLMAGVREEYVVCPLERTPQFRRAPRPILTVARAGSLAAMGTGELQACGISSFRATVRDKNDDDPARRADLFFRGCGSVREHKTGKAG
jgi:hypothetical protein